MKVSQSLCYLKSFTSGLKTWDMSCYVPWGSGVEIYGAGIYINMAEIAYLPFELWIYSIDSIHHIPSKNKTFIMTLSQYEKSFKLAREQYRSVYCGGPYTNIDMIQYLIDKSMIEPPNHQPSRRATIDDYVSRPDLVRRVTLEKMREDEMNTTGALHPLFAGRTGLCTSFAIKTAYSLKSLDQPAIYNFVFYDLGMHRLSICKNTKILIDSSALRPLRLQDGKELKVHRKIYCYENQELKFRREGEGKDQVRASFLILFSSWWMSASITVRSLQGEDAEKQIE